jgi:hypothetical protein
MPEDHLERKTYRKSPGRQYGYEYDPLQSHSGRSQNGSTASRSGMLLSQRPDPRRTRQLLRQSIIASRRLDDTMLEEDQPELHEPTMPVDRSRPTRHVYHSPMEERPRPSMGHIGRTRFVPMRDEGERFSPRYRENTDRVAASAEPYLPPTREFVDDGEVVQEEWPRQEGRRYVDPDLGLDEDEYLEQETYDYTVNPRARSVRTDVPSRASRQLKPRRATTRRLPEELLQEELPERSLDEDYIYGEDEELPAGLRVVNAKKPSSSRRKFLIGAGAVVAGGAAVGLVASQSGPKAPLGQVGNNIANNADQQVKDASDKAKRELLQSLLTLETFTLQGAVDAAILTRSAYDVFVSPVVKVSATITGDVLQVMLTAFTAARNLWKNVYQDSATLAAIQTVLQSWVDNVKNFPKQLNAVVDTDLDGAQAYLHLLQRKIEDEMKALNNPTPTPQPTPAPTQKK